jgi:hypothetical protein
MTELKAGDQLYVNSKWYFDVKDVNDTDIKVRIKYFEGTNKDYYLYKVIKLPVSLFVEPTVSNFIVNCKVSEKDLKRQIGGLIDRLVKESDISKILEEMGAVSSPGLSGTAGVPGSAGSGDVSNSVLPSNSYGLEIIPKVNRKQIRKILKNKKSGNILKTPLLNLMKEDASDDVMNSDNDYKLHVFQMLDYPTDNEWDLKFIEIINAWRPNFIDTSSQRIKTYFKNLYETNRALIVNKCSEWFQNNMAVLAEISTSEIPTTPTSTE